MSVSEQDGLRIEIVPLEAEQLEAMADNFERSGDPLKTRHVARMREVAAQMRAERGA